MCYESVFSSEKNRDATRFFFDMFFFSNEKVQFLLIKIGCFVVDNDDFGMLLEAKKHFK